MVIGLFTRYQLERGPLRGWSRVWWSRWLVGCRRMVPSFGRGFVHGSLQSK